MDKFAIDVRGLDPTQRAIILEVLGRDFEARLPRVDVKNPESSAWLKDAEIFYYEGRKYGPSYSSYNFWNSSEKEKYPLIKAQLRQEIKWIFDGFDLDVVLLGDKKYRLIPIEE